MQPSNWAPKHSDALREFLLRGMSYSEIAAAINAKFGTFYSDGSQMKNAKLLLYKHGASLALKLVSEITPDMIQAALVKLWARAPYQGRRALNMWERVFDFAKAKGWRQGDNPCAWRGMHEYRFVRRRSIDGGHHPAMAYEALPEFLKYFERFEIAGIGNIQLGGRASPRISSFQGGSNRESEFQVIRGRICAIK